MKTKKNGHHFRTGPIFHAKRKKKGLIVHKCPIFHNVRRAFRTPRSLPLYPRLITAALKANHKQNNSFLRNFPCLCAINSAIDRLNLTNFFFSIEVTNVQIILPFLKIIINRKYSIFKKLRKSHNFFIFPWLI